MHWGTKMKKPDSNMDDLALENLFEQARATPPEVPHGLMARVLEDAQTLQTSGKSAGWRTWLIAIGGLPALSGLVTAACVGFWLGVAPPEGLPDLAGQIFGQQDSAELETATDLTGFGWDIEEGNADG